VLVATAGYAEEELPPASDAFRSDEESVPSRGDAAIMEEAARHVGIELHGEKPEGQGTLIQPLDDSDPEMKALIQRYYQIVPCRDEYTQVYCDEALAVLRSGADRLARYLIRHIEENDRGAYLNQGTYVLLLGRTESPVAYDYLRRRMLDAASQVEQRGRADEAYDRLQFAFQGLGYTPELPVIDDAVQMMARFPDDTEITNLAVNALDRVQAGHGPQPRAEQALRAVQARLADAPADLDGDGDSPGGIRARVDRMLAAPGRTR
jgi:hypothetical protein